MKKPNPQTRTTKQYKPKPLTCRTVTPEFPPAAHGQLPIESQRQQVHLSDVEQNLLFYETRNSFPFQPAEQQIYQHQQQQPGSEASGVAPVKFSLPIAPVSAAAPTKIAFQTVNYSHAGGSAPAVLTAGESVCPHKPVGRSMQVERDAWWVWQVRCMSQAGLEKLTFFGWS